MNETKIASAKNFLSLVEWINEQGEEVESPRGKTKEIIGAHLLFKNPRDRLDTAQWRKMNFPFAVAEFLAMVAGIGDLNFFIPFISRMKEFSVDGKTLDGAYGPRIHIGKIDRITEVVRMLTRDKNTRRAVIPIFQPLDGFCDAVINTPCTLNLQFLVRNSKVTMLTYMRSNDVHLGLTSDLAAFTMLQEYISDMSPYELGQYHHYAGSFHYYLDEYKKFEARRLAAPVESRWPLIMLPMKGALNNPKELWNLVNCYQNMHSITAGSAAALAKTLTSRFALDLANSGFCFVFRKSNPEISLRHYDKIVDPTIRRVMRPWLSKEA